MALKENQCYSTSVLTFLSDMSILKVKLVYTAVSGVLLFLSISDVDHNDTKDLKTIAIFSHHYSWEGNLGYQGFDHFRKSHIKQVNFVNTMSRKAQSVIVSWL